MKQAFLVLILIFCLTCVAAKAQDATDVVNFAAPEKYPVAALALRARGEVVVEVQIDSSGKVVSAGAVSGHPLLRSVTEKAALKWEFSKDFAATNKVNIQLVFDYQIEWKSIEKSEKESENITKINHPTNFRLEVIAQTIIPELLLLPRENGELKSEICPIHNQLMTVEIQENACGMISSDDAEDEENSAIQDSDEEDSDAEEEEKPVSIAAAIFPNANVNAFRKCSDNEIKRAEVRFCQICRIKFEDWRRNKD